MLQAGWLCCYDALVSDVRSHAPTGKGTIGAGGGDRNPQQMVRSLQQLAAEGQLSKMQLAWLHENPSAQSRAAACQHVLAFAVATNTATGCRSITIQLFASSAEYLSCLLPA